MFTRKFSLILIFSIILTLGLSISLDSILASWTAPASTPPEGNIAAPINTSDTGQAKQGGLILNTGGSVNGLIVQFGDVGIGTDNPQAKLDVAGNINATGNIIAAAPTASNHLATKAYVDASSGGGSLKVYKSDGTTLLGTFGGFYGTYAPSDRSGWGFWTPAGALHIASAADITATPTPITIYFQNIGCTGNMYFLSGCGGGMICTDGVICATYSYYENGVTTRSKRSPGAGCTDILEGPRQLNTLNFSACPAESFCGGYNLPCLVK